MILHYRWNREHLWKWNAECYLFRYRVLKFMVLKCYKCIQGCSNFYSKTFIRLEGQIRFWLYWRLPTWQCLSILTYTAWKCSLFHEELTSKNVFCYFVNHIYYGSTINNDHWRIISTYYLKFLSFSSHLFNLFISA